MAEIEEEVVAEKLIAKLGESEKYWNSTIEGLTKKMSCSAKEVVPLQAEIISLRQQVSEQIKNMSYQIYKMMPKIKSFKKQRFEYYVGTQAPYITNASERMKIIEWDLADHDYKKDILDNHVEFLRETLKNMDNLNFAIKNKIILYQLTDLE
jgi:hypothetical protein